jgi:hypothetical protein
MLGSLGWLFFFVFFIRNTKRSIATGAKEESFLLWMFILLVILIGIAVVGVPDAFGLGHICLQPLVSLGLAYLAVNLLQCGKPLRALFFVSVVVDFLLGIALHLRVEHYNMDDLKALYQQGVQMFGGTVLICLQGKMGSNITFLGDRSYANYLFAVLILTLAVLLFWSWRTFRRQGATPAE